jgi:hypothetical protein
MPADSLREKIIHQEATSVVCCLQSLIEVVGMQQILLFLSYTLLYFRQHHCQPVSFALREI